MKLNVCSFILSVCRERLTCMKQFFNPFIVSQPLYNIYGYTTHTRSARFGRQQTWSCFIDLWAKLHPNLTIIVGSNRTNTWTNLCHLVNHYAKLQRVALKWTPVMGRTQDLFTRQDSLPCFLWWQLILLGNIRNKNVRSFL